MPRIDALLKVVVEKKGSDLHLAQGNPPLVRIHGELEPLSGVALRPEETFENIIFEILEPHHKEKFIKTGDLDAAYALGDIARFRVNVFRQRGGIGAVLRIIPSKIMSLEEMSLPPVLSKFVEMKRGLILVTGPTGSGKSTTLAAILDAINRSRKGHILTIEEPLEFVHQMKQCLVTHREVGAHAKSFADALRAALRENPDVILVGEMRDLETISMALTASETGILVFGTLHTNSAAKSIDRMVDVFPEKEQETARSILAGNLGGIVSQQLLRTKSGKGRVAAVEILFNTKAVANLIREGNTPMITSTIQSSASEGMVPMEKTLADLVNTGKVNPDAAFQKAMDKDYFQKLCKK